MKTFFSKLFIIWGVITFIPVIVLFALKTFDFNSIKIPINSVLVIDLGQDYPEHQSSNPLKNLITRGGPNFFQLLRSIEMASKDPNIKGITLKVDSLSLGLAQSQEFMESIRNFKKSGKFVCAYAYSLLSPRNIGSRLYYLATCANEIWMQPYSMLSLKGEYIEEVFIKNLLDKAGIKIQSFRRKKYKNAFSNLTSNQPTVEWKNDIAERIKIINTGIINTITANRQININDFIQITAHSPIITGKNALQSNFIDNLAYMDEFEAHVLKKAGDNSQFLNITNYSNTIDKKLQKKAKNSKQKIIIVKAIGEIHQNDQSQNFSMNMQKINAVKLAHTLDNLAKNPETKAIILRINSPGGCNIASEIIRRAIITTQERGIPVIASFSNVAASGAVWLSANCKKIIANPLSITGSIGVLSVKPNIKHLIDKFDLHVAKVFANENDGMWSLFSPYSAGQEKIINNLMDSTYNRFLKIVAEGRDLKTSDIEKIAQGKVWMGIQAKKHGLIDELGGIMHAIEMAKQELNSGEEVVILEYSEEYSLMDRLYLNLQQIFKISYAINFIENLQKTIFGFYNRIITSSNVAYSPVKA